MNTFRRDALNEIGEGIGDINQKLAFQGVIARALFTSGAEDAAVSCDIFLQALKTAGLKALGDGLQATHDAILQRLGVERL